VSYPRYLPEGGRQVPPPYDSDPGAADASRHDPREPHDVMSQLIADHQVERDRQRDLSSGEAGERQGAGWLRRLMHRRRDGAATG
jgi:hypothetical protein